MVFASPWHLVFDDHFPHQTTNLAKRVYDGFTWRSSVEAIKSCEISFRRGDSGGSGRSFFIFLGFSICIPVLAIYYNKIVQQNFVGSLLIKQPAFAVFTSNLQSKRTLAGMNIQGRQAPCRLHRKTYKG